MALLSLKKSLPAGWVTLAGFSLISLNILEKLHSFRPPTVTLSYLLCDDILPIALTSVFIFWSFRLESHKRFGQPP